MVKLLIISVTYHMLQNMISDIITHVPLNTLYGVVTMFCQSANLPS